MDLIDYPSPADSSASIKSFAPDDWQLPPFELMAPIDIPQFYPTLEAFAPIYDDRLLLPSQVPFPDFFAYDLDEFLRHKLSISPLLSADLYALPDPPAGKRPSQPLPYLVMLAIHGSPRKMLTLQEIYTAIQERFHWYRFPRSKKEERAWKGSIRHCLSLWMVFRHRPRPATESGRGHYWYIDLSDGEGYKRERKRRRRGARSSSDHTVDSDEDSSSSSSRSSRRRRYY